MATGHGQPALPGYARPYIIFSCECTGDSGIARNWVLTPTAQYEECRYAGGTWWEEDPFSSFEIHIDWPGGKDTDYMFYAYEVCGDAVNCELISCENITTIAGSTSESVDTMTAKADWYYSVTFSYGTLIPPSQNTGECRGSASANGEHQ